MSDVARILKEARDQGRLTALDFAQGIFDDFIELHGDRNFRDDGAIIGGIAHGFFITLLPALLVTAFNQLGFVNATATDVDTVVVALLYAWLLSPIFKAVGI